MTGGLMQLVANGSEDIYLTGNPQMTFFKMVYKRHTNFAIESIEQSINGDISFGTLFTATIARSGDLLHRLFVEINVTGKGFLVYNAGFKLIDYVEIEIGGRIIDKHYGEWMAIWCDLTHTHDKLDLLGDLINTSATLNSQTLHIPLQFWFCRHPGLALPLIALQYHEVKLNIQLQPQNFLPISQIQSIDSVKLFCDYIYLDTDERRLFTQVAHEYLIEQLQYSNKLISTVGANQHKLRFYHPIKELLWINENDSLGDWAGGSNITQLESAIIQLNGTDRFKRRLGTYFNAVQRYQYHTGYGNFHNINIYSFGLNPEEHQPSGTCNFSRIDNTIINYNLAPSTDPVNNVFKMWAINYNVLRIMSGMGGLAYAS